MELGGTENVILQLCKNFIANYDITVISSGGINLLPRNRQVARRAHAVGQHRERLRAREELRPAR